MSNVRRGTVANCRMPTRHCPSPGDISDIANMKFNVAIAPKPTTRTPVKIIYSQSLLRRLFGAHNTWTRSTKNKYL
jgi:hypothetical protein